MADFFHPRGESSSRGGRGRGRGNRGRGGGGGGASNSQSNDFNTYNSSDWGRGGRLDRMGRGQGNFSAAKAERARAARETIRETIPHILEHNPRAKAGVKSSVKYTPATLPSIGKSAGRYIPKIRVIYSDTFDAAHGIIGRLKETRGADYDSGKVRVAVLNMASNTTPGGGVLRGSLAQEETLCRRSTLYPALTGNFHPMNEGQVVYTKDILVFMDKDYDDLKEAERYWVDVISLAAPKRPELVNVKPATPGGKVTQDYADQADYEKVVMSVRSMMRVAEKEGITHLVLGAFGCGAYGNPNDRVAEVFRRVICGRRFGKDMSEGPGGWQNEEREVWTGVEEVVFGIYGSDRGKGNLDAFEMAFKDVVEWQLEQEKIAQPATEDVGGAGIVSAEAEGEKSN